MRNRFDKFAALFSIGSFVVNILAFSLSANAAPRKSQSSVDHSIRKVVFKVPNGQISLNLPDDIRAGDTISGSVASSPTGDSGSLAGYVFEAEGNKPTRASKGVFMFAVPKIGAISIVVKDSSGAIIGHTVVPVRPSLEKMAANFDLPTMGQTSRPLEITGPFDGDASNTRCTVGGQPAAMIAESPRQAFFTSPTTTIGPGQITLTEANRTQSGPFRNVGVELRAPKTRLTRGEKTTLTVQVSGLQGISQNVPLSLNCTGAVNMQGGNLQQVQIQPNQVQQNGDATLTRNLTGAATGNFDVTATVAVPISNLSGEVVHVEGSPNGGGGLWQVKIKLPGGKVVGIYLRSEQKPDLKFCDWIKIDDVTSENGTLYVGGYKKVPNPTKPPAKPLEPPKPPTEVRPPTTTKPPDTVTPPPCKEGSIRNISSEIKTFEVIDETGTPIFKVYTDKDGAGDAAANMAGFWRDIAEAGGLLDYLPEGTGAGAAAAGWLFEYLDKGADVLDALAKGKLKNTGVSKVTAEVIISTKKITATCVTYEICINGIWVRKKRLEQSEERAVFRAHKTAEKGGDEWDKVSEPSRPQFFDPERAEAWARDFFKEQANILKGNGEGYTDFVKNCK